MIDTIFAEDAELVAELRVRLGVVDDERLAKLGTMLINLGSDAVGIMFERGVWALIVEARGQERE